jgi:hypothetical protein
MNEKTQFEKDLEQDLKDPEFAKEFYLGIGEIKERERIIKLIENEAGIYEDKLIDPHELIERIKGEQS